MLELLMKIADKAHQKKIDKHKAHWPATYEEFLAALPPNWQALHEKAKLAAEEDLFDRETGEVYPNRHLLRSPTDAEMLIGGALADFISKYFHCILADLQKPFSEPLSTQEHAVVSVLADNSTKELAKEFGGEWSAKRTWLAATLLSTSDEEYCRDFADACDDFFPLHPGARERRKAQKAIFKRRKQADWYSS